MRQLIKLIKRFSKHIEALERDTLTILIISIHTYISGILNEHFQLEDLIMIQVVRPKEYMLELNLTSDRSSIVQSRGNLQNQTS